MHEIQGHLVKVSPRRCQKLTARMELQTAAMLADTMGDNQCPCRSIHGALEPILCAWKMRRSKICSASVWPWNQKPRETRRQHLVRYRSSLKNRKTRRTIKRGRNFQALSTLFCAVAGKTSCWGQKSIPRLLEGPTNVASCSNFPGAQFKSLASHCCHVCMAGTANWALEHAMALSSTKTLRDPTFKTSGNEPLGLQPPPQGGGCLSLALDLKAARLKHRDSLSARRAAGALTWAHSSSRAFLQSPWGMSGGLEQSCVGFSNLQLPWTRSTAHRDGWSYDRYMLMPASLWGLSSLFVCVFFPLQQARTNHATNQRMVSAVLAWLNSWEIAKGSGCQFIMWSCAGVLERSNFCA